MVEAFDAEAQELTKQIECFAEHILMESVPTPYFSSAEEPLSLGPISSVEKP